MAPSIFVSYTRHDPAAERVAQRIAAVAGKFTSTYDYQKNPQRIKELGGIKKYLVETMDCYAFVVLVLSQQYFERAPCVQEYTTALNLRHSGKVIAVAVDGFLPPGEARKLDNLNIRRVRISTRNVDAGINSLISIILR
ncbi:MAG: TIR domain-containing protein [Trebonia sp.]